VLPSQCYHTSLAQGGEVLKSMDNCAALAALRHCRTNVVTAHIDSVDFHRPVGNGNLLRTSSRPCFASSKSLEIEVLVEAEDLATGTSWVAARGLLVFVSLDAAGRPLAVPPLPPPQDDAERASRLAARERYELRKRVHSNCSARSTTS
jgi:acyl-CoA hydrolase